MTKFILNVLLKRNKYNKLKKFLEMMNENAFDPRGVFSPNSKNPRILVIGDGYLSDAANFRFIQTLIKKQNPRVVVAGSLKGSEDVLSDVCAYLNNEQYAKAEKVLKRDFLNVHRNIADNLGISFDSKDNSFTQIVKSRIALKDELKFPARVTFERRILSFATEASCFLLEKYLLEKSNINFKYVTAKECICCGDILKGEGSGFDYETSLTMIGEAFASNPGLILTEGGIAKDYVRIVNNNGTDITAALFANACLTSMEKVPALIYLKDEKLGNFQFSRDEAYVNYAQFVKTLRVPYLIPEVINLLELKKIPCKINFKGEVKSLMIGSSLFVEDFHPANVC